MELDKSRISNRTYSWFPCDVTHHKIPLFFTPEIWIQLGHVSQVANFSFSSRKFGEVAVIQKFKYFQNYNGVLYGAVMLDDMPCHIMNVLNFCSYFTKIMTRKPNIGSWTNMTERYPFLESKKWYLLFKWILWSRDLLVKTINSCA